MCHQGSHTCFPHSQRHIFLCFSLFQMCLYLCLSLLQRTEMTAVVMNPPPVQPQRAGKYIHLHRLSIQKHFIGSQLEEEKSNS